MNLLMRPTRANAYTSNSQKIRVLSESWTASEIFCPDCGGQLEGSKNNSKVLDFRCQKCVSEFELKSKAGKFARKVVDGAFGSMMSRIASPKSPHFFFLGYDRSSYRVSDFFVVPNYLLQPVVIEKRKPLAHTARRAGWVGCNSLLDQIPSVGKIYYVKDGGQFSERAVRGAWRKTVFLSEMKSIESRGWALDVLRCIEQLAQDEFTLAEIYRFEDELSRRHPGNNFVKDKIRQQLQVLRDKGYLDFVTRGRYRIIPGSAA